MSASLLALMSGDLDLSVDRTSEVPVGTQLAWKLRTLIALGELSPGARLPGLRELAELAGVNVNTVRSVLARLEERGLLVTQQGRGNFVAETARIYASLAQAAEAAISQAHAAGIDPRELAAALYVSPRTASRLAGVAESDRQTRARSAAVIDDRAARQELRAQIGRLELELGELEPLNRLEQRPSNPQPRVLTAAELREVRDALSARIERLRQQRQEWRAENERALAAERDPGERSRTRRWHAGVWTGRSGASVSWTTT